MRHFALLATWTFFAGAGIPLIGVLNSGLSRSTGNPFAATAVMFTVAMLAALAVTLTVYGFPQIPQLFSAPPVNYTAGLVICFYVLSATVIIPRFGAARFIAFIVVAQLFTSAFIDQLGLFGMARRPLDVTRLAGLAVMVAGIVIMQIGDMKGSD